MKCSEINEWLDRIMDSDVSDDMQLELSEHERMCPECAKKIQATRKMKAMLEQMDNEVDVPLAAQASWRNAVHAEANRRRGNRIYRVIGAVAAAVVLVIGLGWAFKPGIMPGNPSTGAVLMSAPKGQNLADENITAALVESDGQTASETASSASSIMDMEKSAPMHERHMTVRDLDEACNYICDLVLEYEGSADEQRFEKSGTFGANIYITLPSGNVQDFLKATAYLNVADIDETELDVTGEESSSLLMILSMQ